MLSESRPREAPGIIENVTRQRHTAEFKAKIALEVIKDELTLAELAARHGIHQTSIGHRKQ